MMGMMPWILNIIIINADGLLFLRLLEQSGL